MARLLNLVKEVNAQGEDATPEGYTKKKMV